MTLRRIIAYPLFVLAAVPILGALWVLGKVNSAPRRAPAAAILLACLALAGCGSPWLGWQDAVPQSIGPQCAQRYGCPP